MNSNLLSETTNEPNYNNVSLSQFANILNEYHRIEEIANLSPHKLRDNLRNKIIRIWSNEDHSHLAWDRNSWSFRKLSQLIDMELQQTERKIDLCEEIRDIITSEKKDGNYLFDQPANEIIIKPHLYPDPENDSCLLLSHAQYVKYTSLSADRRSKICLNICAVIDLVKYCDLSKISNQQIMKRTNCFQMYMTICSICGNFIEYSNQYLIDNPNQNILCGCGKEIEYYSQYVRDALEVLEHFRRNLDCFVFCEADEIVYLMNKLRKYNNWRDGIILNCPYENHEKQENENENENEKVKEKENEKEKLFEEEKEEDYIYIEDNDHDNDWATI